METLRRILDEEAPPLPPEVPRDLAVLVHLCLEKDPARRLPTALSLAEDLERFLAGEPIHARPPGLSGRALKFYRRHRRVAWTLAAALLVLGLSGAWGLRLLGQARRQAALAQRFGQGLEEVAHRLRAAHLAPLHDRRPQVAWVRQRMTAIRAEVDQLGAWALGPGEAALGTGHLILDEPEEALRLLESAWNRGYRAPEVARDLARTHLRLLQQGLDRAKELPAGRSRDKARDELDRKHREPALAWMEKAGPADAANPLLQAELARIAQKEEAALALARTALEADPAAYEAWILQARIWEARALVRLRKRDEAGSLAAEAEAERCMDQALDLGRSDPRVHLERAAQSMNRGQEEEEDRKGDPLPWFQRALEALARAERSDPGHPRVPLLRSKVQWQIASRLHLKELPRSKAAADEAVASAEAAVAASEPRPGAALSALGLALVLRAEVHLDMGADPHGDLDRAAQVLERAIQLEPQMAAHRPNLSYVHYTRASVAQAGGKDPLPALRKAAEQAKVALDHDAANDVFLGSYGAIQFGIAGQEQDKGQDPSQALAEARRAFETLVQRRPGFAAPVRGLGEIHRRRAQVLIQKGEAPEEDIQAAEAWLAKAEALGPGHEFFLKERMLLAILRAETGQGDPAALGAWRLRVPKGRDPDFLRLLLFAGWWEARLRQKQGQDASEALKAGQRALAALKSVPSAKPLVQGADLAFRALQATGPTKAAYLRALDVYLEKEPQVQGLFAGMRRELGKGHP